jgi:tetratricopeptide (TPR) repeat protein
MFFPRLRRRAKWVFILLAVSFGIGFVAFGVGTGVPGTSIGDVFQDFLGRRSSESGSSVEAERERAQKNPRNAQAQFDLATALQSAGRTREAITVLERYSKLRPGDAEALQQIAVLWGTLAAKARQESDQWSRIGQEVSIGRIFAPPDESAFVQALSQNQVFDGVAQLANERSADANNRALEASRGEAATWEKLSHLRADDASVFLQLGQAAIQAQDTSTAIRAWQRFLELAPDDPSAPLVRQQLKVLEAQTSG